MTNRFRLMALAVALPLVLSAMPALSQTDEDGRSMGDIMADALEDLAASIGSAQDEISDLAPGVDPSDPDSDPGGPASGDEVSPSDIDPGSPADGDDVGSGDIDPSDPGSVPGDSALPAEPAEPAQAAEPEEPGIPIEPIVPPEPDEEGGFEEIQLLPDPVPKGGTWTVTNKPGLVTCDSLGNIKLPKTVQTGRITVRDEGRVLVGRSLFEGQGAPVRMRWNPDLERYEGRVEAAAAGGKTTLDFHAYVIKANRMSGDMIATVNVDAGGVSERCRAARGLLFKRR